MKAKEITQLGEALSQFRKDIIKCDVLKCGDCPLYTSSPTRGCAYAVMQRAVLSAELEAENNEKTAN
jgi:hypothetical protein